MQAISAFPLALLLLLLVFSQQPSVVSGCESGETVVLSDASGQFGSGKYADNTVCMWRITSPHVSKNNWINLKIDSIQLENAYDYVYVFDGLNEDSPQILKWSGDTPPEFTFSSTGPEMFIVFRADTSATGQGFNATYEFRDPCAEGQDAVIYEWKHEITFEADETEPDLICTWKFSSLHSEIHLFPTQLSLTDADTLDVFGDDWGGYVLTTYSGEDATIDVSPIVSLSTDMMLRFERNMSTTGTAKFHATFQTGACKNGEVTRVTGTSGVFTDGSGYGEAYQAHNIMCYWLIEKPYFDTSVIALKFIDFHIRTNDMVIVYDGDDEDAPIIATWTSTTSPPSEKTAIYGSTSRMLVTFLIGPSIGHVTNYDVDGFSASYEFVDPCGGDPLVYETYWSHVNYIPSGILSPSPSSTRCQWLIHNKNPISLYINSIQLNQNNELLNIYEGAVANPSSLIKSLTGHDTFEPTISTSTSLLLELVSQGPRNATSAFSATYQAGICQGYMLMRAPRGEFTDGRNNNERPYPHECHWVIQVSDRYVALDFDFVDLGPGEWIEVYDNTTTLLTVSGVAHPPRVYSFDGTLHVRYFVNTALQGNGFIARYFSGFPVAPPQPKFTYKQDNLYFWWEAPSYEGDSALIGYSVRCFDDMADDFVEVFWADKFTNSTILPLRLISGKRYTCNVVAINSHGESEPSKNANFNIDGFALMPKITLNSPTTSSQIQVLIEAPPNHNYGSQPEFIIERDNGPGTPFITTARISQSSHVPLVEKLTGLDPQTTYRVRTRVSVTGIKSSEYALISSTTLQSTEQYAWDIGMSVITIAISSLAIGWVGVISVFVLVGTMFFFRKRARTKQLVHQADLTEPSESPAPDVQS